MIVHNVASRSTTHSRESDLGLIGLIFLFCVISENLLGHRTFTAMLRGTIFVFAALLVIVGTTEVNHCGTGEKFDDPNQVKISGCDVPPCKLKRRTRPSVEEKFAPDRDVQNVMTSVSAAVLGVPLPFVGVDGTSACENIFNLDGTLAGCSLKKGVEYIYKRDFPVLPIYPTISMVIHYALLEGNHTIACFEVPAKITN